MQSIPIDDVILYRVDDGCAAPKPKEGDNEGLTATKAFVMTCLARRNLEPDFDEDMLDWLKAHESKIPGLKLN